MLVPLKLMTHFIPFTFISTDVRYRCKRDTRKKLKMKNMWNAVKARNLPFRNYTSKFPFTDLSAVKIMMVSRLYLSEDAKVRRRFPFGT